MKLKECKHTYHLRFPVPPVFIPFSKFSLNDNQHLEEILPNCALGLGAGKVKSYDEIKNYNPVRRFSSLDDCRRSLAVVSSFHDLNDEALRIVADTAADSVGYLIGEVSPSPSELIYPRKHKQVAREAALLFRDAVLISDFANAKLNGGRNLRHLERYLHLLWFWDERLIGTRDAEGSV